MCYIACKESKKSGKKYLVLVINGVYVSFEKAVIEKLAMSYGISNIELNDLQIDDEIELT